MKKMNIQLSTTILAWLILSLATHVTSQQGIFNIRTYGAPNGDITNVRSYYNL